MFGERLAELRKLNDDTQQILADKIGFSVWAVRAWEQEKNLPPSDALLAICKLYGTSADYLLGLTDIDPSDEARKQRQRLTEEEQNEMHRYEEYLLWKRKNKPPSETVRSLGGCFCVYSITCIVLFDSNQHNTAQNKLYYFYITSPVHYNLPHIYGHSYYPLEKNFSYIVPEVHLLLFFSACHYCDTIPQALSNTFPL